MPKGGPNPKRRIKEAAKRSDAFAAQFYDSPWNEFKNYFKDIYHLGRYAVHEASEIWRHDIRPGLGLGSVAVRSQFDAREQNSVGFVQDPVGEDVFDGSGSIGQERSQQVADVD